MDNQVVRLFGVKFHKVDEDAAFKKFLYLLNRSKYGMIFAPTSEMVMMAQKDLEYKDILADGDLVIPDGFGIMMASKMKGLGIEHRMHGLDMMENILKYCNNAKKSIYLLGSSQEHAEKAAKNIGITYPNIKVAGYQSGYFDETEELRIVDRINEAKPDILFVTMGAPLQEKWMYKHRKILNVRVAMGVSDAVDIWAGAVKRTPKIFKKIGLEWLYRLIHNPRRIKRATILPKFLLKVLLSRRG